MRDLQSLFVSIEFVLAVGNRTRTPPYDRIFPGSASSAVHFRVHGFGSGLNIRRGGYGDGKTQKRTLINAQ